MDNSIVSMIESASVDLVLVTWGFEDIYRVEYPALVAVARAMTGNQRDGEDLVQDTMVKAYVNWGRVGRLERPGGWCHRVLVNACRSRSRHHRVERRFLDRARREEPSTEGPSPDVLAFWSVVRNMPLRPRAAVALYFAGDHTVPEIAAILSCPEGTVYSDLSRARVVLAAQLGF